MSEALAAFNRWLIALPEADAVFLVRLTLGFVLCLGAIIGSFLNVCVYRIPLGQSVSHPRSHCFSCGKIIPWYLNVPILSWLVLRGRCANCRAPISVRYPLVEAATALLFLLVFQMWGNPALFGLNRLPTPLLILPLWAFVASVVVDVLIDIDHRILLDRISLGGTALAFLLAAFVPAWFGTGGWWEALLASLGGAAAGFGVGFAIAWVGERVFLQDAFGFGDVKWLMLFGALFGWRGALCILMIAAFVGLGMGLAALLSAKLRRRGGEAGPLAIPFGPALGTAALLWLFWSDALVRLAFSAHAWAFQHRGAFLGVLLPLLLISLAWLLHRIRAIRAAVQEDDGLEPLSEESPEHERHHSP